MDLRKQHSREHEEYIAKTFSGKRSPSSGASIREKGDIITETHIIECKLKGSPGNPVGSTLVKQMEKVYNEALEVDKWPLVALRFYNPKSPLANHNGYIDLAITLVDDVNFGIKE